MVGKGSIDAFHYAIGMYRTPTAANLVRFLGFMPEEPASRKRFEIYLRSQEFYKEMDHNQLRDRILFAEKELKKQGLLPEDGAFVLTPKGKKEANDLFGEYYKSLKNT